MLARASRMVADPALALPPRGRCDVLDPWLCAAEPARGAKVNASRACPFASGRHRDSGRPQSLLADLVGGAARGADHCRTRRSARSMTARRRRYSRRGTGLCARDGAEALRHRPADHPREPLLVGRSERIRTSGPCVPNTVLYQAELHSGSRPEPLGVYRALDRAGQDAAVGLIHRAAGTGHVRSVSARLPRESVASSGSTASAPSATA